MFLTERLPEEPELRFQLRRSINNAWKCIYSELARDPNRLLDEDEFLSAHLSVYRNPGQPVFFVDAAEKRLFEMFSTHAENYPYEVGSERNDDAVSREKILAYVADLASFARPWSDVLLTEDEQVEKIVYLDGGKYVKVALAALSGETSEDRNTCLGKNFDRIDFRAAKDYTVEHVLPRTWETYWRSTVEEFSNDPNADSQVPNPQKVLINTLGNLLLLDGSTNSGIGNNPWEIKHKRINSGKSYGEYDVGLHSTWGKKEIEARGRDLLKFLGELIGCAFSEEQVQKALFASPELYAKGFALK